MLKKINSRFIIAYKSDFNLWLTVFRLIFFIVSFLVLEKLIREGFDIILAIFLYFGIEAGFGFFWMLFGTYLIQTSKEKLYVTKKIIIPFRTREFEIDKILEVNYLQDYKTKYSWGTENLYFTHKYEHAVSISTIKKKFVFFIPDKNIYYKIKQVIGKDELQR